MRQRRLLISLAAAAALVGGAVPALAAPSTKPTPPASARRQFDANHRLQKTRERAAATDREAESGSEVLEGSAQWSEARTSPGLQVPGAALSEAAAQAGRLPVRGGAWSQVTTGPYDNDAAGYADPVWSNYGAGWGLVSGRNTALATDGGWLYAGFADGGVWTSRDGGRHWSPTFQHEVTSSIGALWVDPSDHSLWVGTGEANTSSDSYAGQGVWRSTDHGRTFRPVGGAELRNSLIFSITASDRYVFAATSRGLWRRDRRNPAGTPWSLVLKPDPNPTDSPYQTSFITDVAIRPGSGGQSVLAVLGWRGGSDYNGFYLSNAGGAAGSFTRITPAGLDNSDIGRTSLSYTPKGDALYAVIQSPEYTNDGPPAPAQSTALKGVYKSANGDPNGPWTQVADVAKLAQSGSALSFPSTYEPGIQTWYDEYIKVDPADPNHVYLGLEEVFETRDGGRTWHAIAPYWNLVPQCYTPGGPDKCPFTTHPDQHGIAIGGDGTLYVGNDGGVWSRPTSLGTVAGWRDLNRDLHTLQYYYAETGRDPQGGTGIWGGLQDNGTSLLPGRSPTMVSPFGGDGGDVLVDPGDSDRAAVEYTDASIAVTANGGRSDGTTPSFRLISPACEWNPDLPGCDPSPRFIAPFEHDAADVNHWITGGRYVWESTKGFDTTCSGATCDWKPVFDAGDGSSVTAVETNHGVSYAGWCGPCNPLDDEGTGFVRGLATNYGGTWHTINAPNLPNRYVAAITTDPADPAHVYVVFSGYSRHWIPNAGVGHVFESRNGGATWTDISGDLPDVPGDDLIVWHGHLVLATDHLVYVADTRAPARWSRLGRGLPHSVAADLSLYPSGSALLVATHGRGLWRLTHL
ncbi:beta propeller repeat protein [Actinoallomurus rhizosphaericola]|uniref:hypothetical protein n=1 Tax=Actinoallomurus rhizosphaericola TaxID=2952536 RepID=UPI0020917DDD|nr:hypothetical protein [Actinoallomurus rhizosphaericola]MCO5993313.1 hypothetical protein [Actinoallomurus rhizosphaericola]